MIKKLELTNFRNIKHQILELNNKTSIIEGANGLGKSNTLNAIMYILCDAIITDNGTNESDINSIIPQDFKRGDDPVVSIWVDETKFTKTLKSTFKKGTDIVNGHTTEYSVNDVKVPTSQFNEELYAKFDYMPSLKKFSPVEEMKLYVDPLRALSKIKPEQLRELLINLGCGVSNEEIYALGFEDLRQYDSKYLGEFKNMRKDLKKQLDLINKNKDGKTRMLAEYVVAQQFNPEELIKLQDERDSLTFKQKEIVLGTNKDAIKELEFQLNSIKEERRLFINSEKMRLENSAAILRNQIQLENSKVILEKDKLIKPFKDASDNNRNEGIDLKRRSAQMQAVIDEASRNLKLKCIEGTEEDTRKKDLLNRLESLTSRTFGDYATCPNCGEVFAPNEEALEAFEINKNEDITNCKKDIEICNTRVQTILKECERLQKVKKDGNSELAKLNQSISENAKKQIELDASLFEETNKDVIAPNTHELNSKLDNIEKEIDGVENNPKAKELELKAIELNQKISLLKTGNESNKELELKPIIERLSVLSALIDKEYLLKSKWATKCDIQAQIENYNIAYNDTECLFDRVDKFCKTMTRMLNKKATEKFGITFVMQVENLTNDDVKDVCYVTVNDVPFQNVNTSERIHTGITFVNKFKEIVAKDNGINTNGLPILADRLEAVDDIEKIKEWSDSQLIATRPNKELKSITIL